MRSGKATPRWTRLLVSIAVVAAVGASVAVVSSSPATGAGTAHVIGLVDPDQGLWHLYDDTGTEITTFYYGNPGDTPLLGDWNGDGVESPGAYRTTDGFVYLRDTNTEGTADVTFFFGDPGDIPLAGDFDGDGIDTVSIYRPSNQTFYIINALGQDGGQLGAAEVSYVFGNPGDRPFVGDFDGDGIETVGLHRESTGLVYFRNSHTQGPADVQFVFGDPGDRFVAGDWDGDGVFTPALFRPATTTLFFKATNSQGNADASASPGNAEPDWVPVAGDIFGEIVDVEIPTTTTLPPTTIGEPPCEIAVTDLTDTRVATTELRDAIETVCRDEPATITVAPGTVQLSLGELVIPSGADITIQAAVPGAGATIDAAGTSRVFRVPSGSSLTLRNVTVTGGAPATGAGAGILSDGDLTLESSTVTGNTASAGNGGGLASTGTLSIIDSTISGNRASAGGGIHTTGTGVISGRSAVTGNTATRGGGIFNTGELDLRNRTAVSGNTATVGGGIATTDLLRLRNRSTVRDNVSTARAGGIDNTGRVELLDNSTLNANSAGSDGGGIYNDGTLIVASDIIGNTAGDEGGGIYNEGTVDFRSGARVFDNEPNNCTGCFEDDDDD